MYQATIIRETEKAILLKYCTEIYGEFCRAKAWFPKSQLNLISRDGDRLTYEPKNDWILDVKTKEYFRYLEDCNLPISGEMQLFISRVNNETITRTF